MTTPAIGAHVRFVRLAHVHGPLMRSYLGKTGVVRRVRLLGDGWEAAVAFESVAAPNEVETWWLREGECGEEMA